jgi:hypothetical protein
MRSEGIAGKLKIRRGRGSNGTDTDVLKRDLGMAAGTVRLRKHKRSGLYESETKQRTRNRPESELTR